MQIIPALFPLHFSFPLYFEESIHNLTSIGADAMCKTDDMILNIMTSKQSK